MVVGRSRTCLLIIVFEILGEKSWVRPCSGAGGCRGLEILIRHSESSKLFLYRRSTRNYCGFGSEGDLWAIVGQIARAVRWTSQWETWRSHHNLIGICYYDALLTRRRIALITTIHDSYGSAIASICRPCAEHMLSTSLWIRNIYLLILLLLRKEHALTKAIVNAIVGILQRKWSLIVELEFVWATVWVCLVTDMVGRIILLLILAWILWRIALIASTILLINEMKLRLCYESSILILIHLNLTDNN